MTSTGASKEPVDGEPGDLPRPQDRLVAATVAVGLGYVASGVLLLLTEAYYMNPAFRTGARLGMVVCIVASAVLALLWYWRRTGSRGPGFMGMVEMPGELLDAQAYRFEDLEVVKDSSLKILEGAAERVAALEHEKRIYAVGLVRDLLTAGFSVLASDIHLTPEAEGTRVTFRVDGVLHEIGLIPKYHTRFVTNRIKVMAALSIHVHAVPQDGRFTFDTEMYQARVSTLPTNHGEKIVIRLAINDENRYSLEAIGFDEETLTLYKTLLSRDAGVIFLTGPTGSGKTTTMYASMLYVREHMGDKLNLVTLEDPMEIDFSGISQTQVNNTVGLDFATGLRSILRQDPDVIMVGEIRDEETAQTAIRAGLTGHLLLTSVHADSTAGVFNRLQQLGVDRFQIAGASIAVVNQRLAIRNCPDCIEKATITELQKKQLALLGFDMDGDVYALADEFFEGTGCEACRGKGRRGRVPLLEVLKVDDEIRDLMLAGTPKHDLEHAAAKAGMRTLEWQAMDLARRGVLPVEEVIRVLSIA